MSLHAFFALFMNCLELKFSHKVQTDKVSLLCEFVYVYLVREEKILNAPPHTSHMNGLSCVCPHMGGEASILTECLTTYITLVRFLSCMDPHMLN